MYKYLNGILHKKPHSYKQPQSRSAQSLKQKMKKKNRHVFVKHGCPLRQQSHTMAKSLSPTF